MDIPKSRRLCVGIFLIVIPLCFLARSIHGSFLFTFSIPFIWEYVVRKRPIAVLGLARGNLGEAFIAGGVSGVASGFLGGWLLKAFNIQGVMLTESDALRFSLGSFEMSFPLQKELGYRLLSQSSSPAGLTLYFLFSLFLIGLGEEIFWRGFLQPKIAMRTSEGKAVFLGAALFALIHFYIFIILPLPEGAFLLGLIFFAGLLWGYLRLRFHTIWAPALSHGIAAFILWRWFFYRSPL